ncbi:MAG: RNA polymerase factor sigma-54, partial [Methylotenera sp.]
MKQNLQLRMSQNLALTPQLQQSIRLLQLSSLELNQELDTILQENPLLELVDGEDAGEDFEAGFDEGAQQKSADNDPVDADGQQTIDRDDAFSNVDYQETSISNGQESTETQQESTAAADDFSATDFDESYDEYGSAS